MKITIPATTAVLHSLFSAGQIAILKKEKGNANAFSILLTNNSGTAFFIEKGGAAVADDEDSAPVLNGRSFVVTTTSLKDWQVISASGNIDVAVTSLNN